MRELFGRPVTVRLVTMLGIIFATVAGFALAFAYTAGALTPSRLTPTRMVDALADRGGDPTGHRRNHAKGICFTGTLQANGQGSRLSTASMFAAGRYPVIGRFATAVGDPLASDSTARVRSMAIRVVAPDGQEWRSGMNSSPVFAVSTPDAFYAITRAADLDPATGHPDPQALPRFVAAHPEAAGFIKWASTASWTASFAEEDYNSLNAFRLVAEDGTERAARWSMRTTEAAHAMSPAELSALGADFLREDLLRRLAVGQLHWRLVVVLAAPGDPTHDATKAWPPDREQVQIGMLIVEQAQDESRGPCRDFNFDPLILPTGIKPSDDPLIAARSSSYANSFARRAAESRSVAGQGTPEGVAQ